jgi:hypothetical protein
MGELLDLPRLCDHIILQLGHLSIELDKLLHLLDSLLLLLLMLILHEIRISSQTLVGTGHELILLSLSLILLRLELLGRIVKDALVLLLLHVLLVKVTYDIPLIVAIKLIIICKHLLL